MNSRLKFHGAFKDKNDYGPPFLPLMYAQAAKISQISLEEMAYDPTYFANAMDVARSVLGADAVVTNYDITVEAEACGCECQWCGDYEHPQIISIPQSLESLPQDIETCERISVILEATKRLQSVMSKEYAIIGTMTGPQTLTQMLNGLSPEQKGDEPQFIRTLSSVSEWLIRYVKKLCECKLDAVIVREGASKGLFFERLKNLKEVQDAYTTLFNIIELWSIVVYEKIRRRPVFLPNHRRILLR